LQMNQTLGAAYRYDAYGRTLTSSGTLAAANVYRFSSKELMVQSGLYYFGYRFYDPLTQRWMNRDPIGEAGGINLYGFVGNGPIDNVDRLGLSCWVDMSTLPQFTGGSDWPGTSFTDLDRAMISNSLTVAAIVTPFDEMAIVAGCVAKVAPKIANFGRRVFKICPEVKAPVNSIRPGSYDDKPPGWNEMWDWHSST